MEKNDTNTSITSLLQRYGLLAFIWSVLAVGSLLWAIHQESRNTLSVAAAAARANIDKDLGFRRWATSHGGVYVPPTEHTPPNPYLKLPDRDVVTTTGRKLTLMNPAYVLREFQTDFPGDFGIRSHITSLKLLNPKNAPDAWEAGALRAFEQGEKERLEVQQMDGQPYLRLMQPLIAESGCLKCHGFQGYKVGDIRGGLSANVPLTPYLARERELSASLAMTHGAIWLVGLAGLGLSYRRDRNLSVERGRTKQELLRLNAQNRLILDSAGEGIYGLDVDGRCTFANPAALQLLGFGIEELLGQHTHSLFHHTRPDGSPYPEDECPVQAAYKQGEIHRGDDRYWRKDGSSFPVEFISTSILEAGKVTGAVVAFRDITERKRAEEQLRRSEHGLAEAQRIAHLGSWELDLVSNALVWSDEIYRIFEIDPEKFGASYEAFLNAIHPEDRELVNKAYTDSVRDKVPYDIVHRLQMPDGRIKYVNENCETYYGKDGKPLRSVGTVHDITERKKAEMELREINSDFVTLLENTGDFIYFKGKDSRFRFCSQTLASVTGHRSWRDMIGKHDLEVFPPDTARVYYEEEQPIFREGKALLNKTDPYYDEQGKMGWVNTNKWPVFGDDKKTVVGIFGISRDITELKQAEDRIVELNRDLERRVVARTAELEAANKELEAFSYSVSHDLRTPLRAIDGFSNILLEDYRDQLDDEGKRLLDVVRDNAGKMGQLIDDILKFSRAGRLELTSVEIDMERMAREVFAELQPAVDENKLQMEIEHLQPAYGDRAMMRQVFVNLLSNAIKFSGKQNPARIKIGSYIEGDEAVYYVKDNGAGFDMRFADKLFGVFQRLHGVTEFEGSGIGLAIVKRIVTRHGGRVWAEGKVDEGATLYFALPAKGANRG